VSESRGATYRNYEHYIREGWSPEPKRTFVRLAEILRAASLPEGGRLLDVGCATGELVHYLRTQLPGLRYTGADVFEALLATARRLVPEGEFVPASALDLPAEMTGAFDAVTAVGVVSIFDDVELARFLDNLLRVARPGGRIIILGPFNEHGVDCLIRHRKRVAGQLGPWETGWNIHSRQTVSELLEGRCRAHRFEDFRLDRPLPPREDPVRTWTIRTESNDRQLTNGLKLLVDLAYLEIEC
jgi:SAM-dependent methyltransferase